MSALCVSKKVYKRDKRVREREMGDQRYCENLIECYVSNPNKLLEQTRLLIKQRNRQKVR